MKRKLKKLLAIAMSMVLVMTVITVHAADEYHIEWFVTQNAEDQTNNYPDNWPFTYEYFDVSSKSFATMEKDLGNTGWADATESTIIKPWEQVATDSKYAVVIYYASQKGNVTIQNRQDFSGTGQVMLLQKNEDGNFALLKDWTNAGTTWEDTTTYVKADECIYFIYRAESGSASANFVPQVQHDKDSEDTGNLYPTTWKTAEQILFPSTEPKIETWKGEISWFVTQNATDQATNYPNNWPFTYEYFDVTDKEFKTMEKDLGETGWADASESAIITPWTQNATDSKYAAVVYYATQKGTVLVQNKDNAVLSGVDEDAQIMLLQKKADGTFSVLQDWKDIPKDGTLPWTEVATYVEAGEMIYFVYRSASSTRALVQYLTPQITQYLGNEDTENLYPTTWNEAEKILCSEQEKPEEPEAPKYETWTGDISWYVTQEIQPWEGSPFTFDYFDAEKMEFYQLETWNNKENPAYWQDTTGMVCVKGWEMVSTDVKYATTTFHADKQGTVTLTNNTTIAGSGANGEFMLLQKNAEGKYAVLLDWTTVSEGQSVTLPNVTTYVQNGESIYYLYRSTSESQAVVGMTPSVIYNKGVEDEKQQYPTTWKALDQIFDKKEDENPEPDSSATHYEIEAKPGTGGSIQATYGSNEKGKDLTYQFVPKKGYEITDVIVDGVSLGKTTRFTFTELRDEHTIEVKFSKIKNTVAR